MISFEDLSVSPEMVEALASEGIEAPTPIQQDAIPLVRKGNSLVLAAGPGSGLLAAWSVGLLDRIEPDGDSPKILVLCATADTAEGLAEPVARMTSMTGHTVAALGGNWVLPERAHIVFGTVDEVLHGLSSGRVAPDAIEAIVVDQAQLMEALGGLADIERVFDYLPAGAQRVLSALPMSPAVVDFVERHIKRAMTVPAPPSSDSPKRGEVRFRIAPEPTEAAALAVIDELFSDGARHALVFCRNEDRAADVGDYLTLHGFTAGAPGDVEVPVWLGVDALEARPAVKDVDGVVVVSCDVPTDTDTLDRRHSMGDSGVIIVATREVAHLRLLGKHTGYDTVPFPPPTKDGGAVDQIRDTLTRAMETEDTGPYLLALAPLFERYDPAEVAAAAVSLLRKRDRSDSGAAEPASHGSAASRATATPSWAKLFVGVGERDGLRAGDLLGAITGETGVPGDAVGKIEIKESHSLVEVHDSVARTVIQAINGTTIKGRAVRADFDRPRRGSPKRGASPRG